MSFATMVANLNLNIKNFSNGLKTASQQVESFASSISSKLNKGLVDPVKKSAFQFKDVSRIVQGIIISKIFYQGLTAIRACTSAVWDFTTNLEYAKIAYANLFKSTSLATEFVNVLQDFAAKTPFTFMQASDAAKRLLAYGVQAKNVMYVMRGVLDASAITGNPGTVEAVSRAFGQIVTKGRLMNEEMRQLTDAGIPAYDILQKKLGLTQKQLQNLGRTSISSATAINALVSGLNERYGSAVNATALTMKGLLSNIADDAKYMAAEIFTPITSGIRAMLIKLESFMRRAQELLSKGGLGAVFENFVPKSMQGDIRQFIAELDELWNIIKSGLAILKTFIRYAAAGAVKILNIILPIIITAGNILTNFLYIVSQNKTAMSILSYALGLAAIAWTTFASRAVLGFILKPLISTIKGTASALLTLGKALVANPILTILSLVFIALAGITLSSTKAGQSLKNFFKQLTNMNGVKTDSILLPKSQKRASDLSKFNNKLTDTSKGMDKLADSTKKASKAAKGAKGDLQSFDEVYTIKDKNANVGADNGALSDLGDLGNLGGIGGTGGLNLDSLMPKNPDFLKFGQKFGSDLWNAIKGSLASIGIGAGIGAILGGIIGGIFGGLPGAALGGKIGAAVGAIIGLFWSTLTTPQKWSVGIGAGAGAVLGGIIGTLISPGLGTLIGAALGTAAGGGIGYFWNTLTTPQKWQTGTGAGIGAIIGGIVGTIIAPGLGTALGAILGGAAGGAIGRFWGNITKAFGDAKQNIESTWSGVEDWWQANVWTPIGTKATETKDWLSSKFAEAQTNVQNNWQGTQAWWQSNVWTPLNDDSISVKNTVAGAFVTAHDIAQAAWAPVEAWWQEHVWNPLNNKATETKEWLGAKFDEAKTNMQNKWQDTQFWWQTNVWTPLHNKSDETRDWLSKKFDEAKQSVNSKWQDTQSWWQFNVWMPLNIGAATTGANIHKNFDEAKSKVSTTWAPFQSWWTSNVWTPLSVKASETGNNIYKNLLSARDNIQNAWKNVGDWFENHVWGPIKGGFGKVKDWFKDRTDTIKKNLDELAQKGATITGQHTSKGTASVWSNNYAHGGIVKALDKAYPIKGHAVGGIFNKEHIARFAEGNKTEAIIPLQNKEAMQPFVDAVATGIVTSLVPFLSTISHTSNGADNKRPVYVGALIADQRGIKELKRQLDIIQMQES